VKPAQKRGARAVEMAEQWKAWKAKNRLSTLPTAPWKSRPNREIPTFPQLRQRGFILDDKESKPQERIDGLWKSGNPKPGFPLSHSPDSLRRKENRQERSVNPKAVYTKLLTPPRWARFHVTPFQ